MGLAGDASVDEKTGSNSPSRLFPISVDADAKRSDDQPIAHTDSLLQRPSLKTRSTSSSSSAQSALCNFIYQAAAMEEEREDSASPPNSASETEEGDHGSGDDDAQHDREEYHSSELEQHLHDLKLDTEDGIEDSASLYAHMGDKQRRARSDSARQKETKVPSSVRGNLDHDVHEGDATDHDSIQSTRSRASTEPHVAVMSDAEKLEAVIDEFGPAQHIAGYDHEERIVASEPAVLVRRVVVRGFLVLTTHRLCFIALLTSSPPSTEALWQGPATLHRGGFATRKRKVWFTLTSESLTAYPSSTELYEPIGGIRLAHIRDVQPDLRHRSINFTVRGQKTSMEFDTKEGALALQREIDAAIWKHDHAFEKIRVCVPLIRLAQVDLREYLDFSTMIHLDVLDIDQPEHRHPSLHRHSYDPMTTQSISFAVLQDSKAIEMHIKPMVVQFSTLRSRITRSKWWQLPSAVIDIDGPQTNDADAAASLECKDSPGSLFKKQRAMLKLFALECKPEEVSIFRAHLSGSMAFSGTLAISPNYLSFSCKHKLSGLADTRLRVPLIDVTKTGPCRAFLWHLHGVRISIHAHEDLIFDLFSAEERDRVLDAIKRATPCSTARGPDGKIAKDAEKREKQMRSTKIGRLANQGNVISVVAAPSLINYVPRAINDGVRRLRIAPMKVHCLTIGSRGDVQPYIALCKALQKHGHTTTIVSHEEYRDWVEGHGIGFRPVGGDPSELMKFSVDNSSFLSPGFYREAMSKFRGWLDELLRGIMEQCWDADLIIESPSTFGGIHVAEAVDCYYMRAFTMPWTKTSEYPQAFAVPAVDLGPQYNAMTYNLFDQVLWLASSGQVNRWRRHMLHLQPTDLAKLNKASVPFMYNFSPAVVPPPLDWGDRIKITGYWNLPTKKSAWTPPDDLLDFLHRAGQENKKLCYIGFGSITMSDPESVQEAIYEAVERSDIRAIVSRGWSARLSTKKRDGDEEKEELQVPRSVYVVDSIPHDWLFPRIDIAMHHGGAGTTGASLQNGLVTLIHPFFGDQYFWSQRVAKLGAGVRVKSLSADDITEALQSVRDDRLMREKAQRIASEIRKENGTQVAIEFIYHNLIRAKRPRLLLGSSQPKRTLSSRRRNRSGDRYCRRGLSPSAAPVQSTPLDENDDTHETIGQDANADVQKKRSSVSAFLHAATSPTKFFHGTVSDPPESTGETTATERQQARGHSKAPTSQDSESSDEDETNLEDAQEARDKLRNAMPPGKRSSWYSQNLHLPSFGINQWSMPHMHLFGLPMLGLHHDEPEKKGAGDPTLLDGDTSAALAEHRSEHDPLSATNDEQVRQKKLSQRDAREEDKRRRQLLEDEWRRQGREDLLAERGRKPDD